MPPLYISNNGVYANGVISWTVASIAAGASTSLQFSAVVTGTNAQVITNTAIISDPPGTGGNPSAPPITITALPKYIASKLVSGQDAKGNVEPGQSLTYTGIITNTGTASGIFTVTDQLDLGFDTTSLIIGQGGSFADGVVTWPNLKLTPGASMVVTLTAMVASTATNGEIINNTIVVTPSDSDKKQGVTTTQAVAPPVTVIVPATPTPTATTTVTATTVATATPTPAPTTTIAATPTPTTNTTVVVTPTPTNTATLVGDPPGPTMTPTQQATTPPTAIATPVTVVATPTPTNSQVTATATATTNVTSTPTTEVAIPTSTPADPPPPTSTPGLGGNISSDPPPTPTATNAPLPGQGGGVDGGDINARSSNGSNTKPANAAATANNIGQIFLVLSTGSASATVLGGAGFLFFRRKKTRWTTALSKIPAMFQRPRMRP